jgi:predicted N-formylglutamate amidohydrolase
VSYSAPVPSQIIVSCEHGGNRIPPNYRSLFLRRTRLLQSHRGYDRGALWLARWLARRLGAPLYAATVSRLLIDLNRSLHNSRVFSDITRSLDPAEREWIVDRYYRPHRELLENHIREVTASGTGVVHLAIHTFTPRLRGDTRTADVGLLYDPRRSSELELCLTWQRHIAEMSPALRVRRNYPYRGTADGLTPHLRRQLPPRLYAGIELEVNQRLVTKTGSVAAEICEALVPVF